MPDYDAVLKIMHEYFKEHGKTMSIEYTFGYFDCLAVLRRIKEGRGNE